MISDTSHFTTLRKTHGQREWDRRIYEHREINLGEKGRDIKLEIYIQIRERKIQTLRKREGGGGRTKV